MHRVLVASAGVLLVLGAADALAAKPVADAQRQWGHWRGPLANGVAPHGDPPATWDAETNIKWKTPIPGRGSASPVVWGDRVFLLTAVNTGRTDEGVEQTAAEQPSGESADASSEATAGDGEGRRERGRFGRGDRGGRGGLFGRRAGPQTYHQYTVVCVDRAAGDVLWQRVAREAVPLVAVVPPPST